MSKLTPKIHKEKKISSYRPPPRPKPPPRPLNPLELSMTLLLLKFLLNHVLKFSLILSFAKSIQKFKCRVSRASSNFFITFTLILPFTSFKLHFNFNVLMVNFRVVAVLYAQVPQIRCTLKLIEIFFQFDYTVKYFRLKRCKQLNSP